MPINNLYSNPRLAARLNATYPSRGVFKVACLNPSSNPAIDQKATINFSVAHPRRLSEIDPAIIRLLGEDFGEILVFLSIVEAEILPILNQATSRVAGADLDSMHANRYRNINLRLIDYFSTSDPTGPRYEHRDYETYTITFQDGIVGGLEFEINGQWVPVPTNVTLLFLGDGVELFSEMIRSKQLNIEP